MSSKLSDFFKSYAETQEEGDNLLEFKLAHEVLGEKVPVISTGSLLLNEALGCFGLPKGRIIQYYGPAGGGKTFASMCAIKEAQKEDPTAHQVFIDAEQTFSTSWADQIGIDTSKVIVIEKDLASNGRRCFEMLLGVPKEDAKTHILIGKKKDGLLDQIAKGELNINLIVLDSLGAIVPPQEDVAQVGRLNMALLARFLTPTFRKLSVEVNKAKIPFIVINHKKDSMDPYGQDHGYSGGNSYTHFLSMNVYFEGIQRKDAQIINEKEQKIGHLVRATVEKNKMASWPRKVEFKMDFTQGIVGRHEEIAQLALDYEIVKKPSTVTHEYGDQKWVGFGKYCEAIETDPALAAELEQKIIEARNSKFEKKRVEQEERRKLSLEKAEETVKARKTRKKEESES